MNEFSNHYTLEQLSEIFFKHVKDSLKIREEMKQKWIENNSEDLPDYMKDDFLLPEALLCIVEEIIKLKKNET